ncbi:DNA polymerase I [Thiohalobacter thiocyanaticus]|uniref:DNA polymerase I n=1 Tax=Thiohalobacter thiocyanaticus TaxID=585455 RepID=A0A1Z4VMC9_9GAMM|nr:DNA polymerase I [Thiohalobacter thiocyanaticus]BAZ92769.1 DNA polymerase I [Thiohalobacter thiocyanaticus]
MPSTKPVVLVDGSSYLYRAFHALPPLTNSRGEPTGAVYGVVNMLKRLLKDYQPEHVAVVFDARGKTFRDEMFEHYKANRPPMPEELAAQIEPLHALVRALGFPVLQVPGVEADDVIGTLARQADARGEPVLISTGDKDMAQLVEGGITLVNTMSNTTLDRAGVVEKFGVPPERIVDYLALVGDSSDNIPGVPKVGPKTAAKWLNEYGSLDALIEQAESVKGKVGESLRENLAQLDLSRQLATIRCDLELEQDVDALAMQPPDRAALKALYEQMEFRTWLKEILGSDESAQASETAAPPAAEVDYETVLTQTQLDAWLKELEQADHFAFDTETTSLEYMQAEIVGLSFAVETHRAAYVPLAHDYAGAPEQLDRDRVLKQFRKLLEDKAPKKIGHNLKYDMSVLANHGIELRGIAFDTMLESYVLDSTASRHDMDSLALKYLAHKCTSYEEVAGKGAKQLSFNEVPVEAAAPYAAEDADITLRLHQTLWPRLQQEKTLEGVFNDIDLPLVPVLSRMERNGVKVDRDMLATQSGELAQKMAEIEEAAFQEAGQPFNIGSPKQIQEILFDQQGLPVLAKTPKGAPSTAESVLAELALDYRLPRLILDYRSLSKLKSTYTDKLPERIDARTGRVHTSYHQAVAATGRLSSTEPNLQNIPVRTESGRRIRQAFIAEQGYRILAADYSQIELRIMAHLSGDEGLLAAFAAGEDIHRATAAEVFGAQPDQVTSEQRRSAKAINFGLIYGMSAFGLAKQLGIERGAAQEYVDLYFARYPGVKAYMDRTREQAHDQGYVETLFGRRLYLPEINARNHQRRTAAERTAINAPMQGTAADIIKLAMISTDAWIRSGGLDLRMVMQVHDELVFEVAAGDVEAAQAAIRERMQTAAELAIPLEVEVGVGANWDEAH